MKLVTRSQWGARAPRRRVTRELRSASTGHWNGGSVRVGGQTTFDHSKCAALVRGTQNFHMDGRGWSDIAYNFLVCQHGYVFEGRGLNVVNGANGTNTANQTSHAVTNISGEGDPFTDAQKVGFRECIRYINERTQAPGTVVGHRDHKATACPGEARYTWIRQGMPLSPAPAQPTNPSSGWPVFNPHLGQWSLMPLNQSKPVLKVGSTGDFVAYLQGVIAHRAGGNISIDGNFGPHTEQRVKEVQNFFKLGADGIVGSKTWGVIDYLASR